MSKHIVFVIFLLVVLCLSAEVQDLPDIEISGPSTLRSTLEKKGRLYPELYLKDVTDSLNPIFPSISEKAVKAFISKKYAVQLDMSNLGFNAYLLKNRFISVNNTISVNANYFSPQKKWSNFYGGVDFLHNTDSAVWGLSVNNVHNKSPKLIKLQSDSSVEMLYQFDEIISPKLPITFSLNSAIHSYVDKENITNDINEDLYFAGSVLVNYHFLPKRNLLISAALIQDSPVFSAETVINQTDEELTLDFIKSISFFVSDTRIVPGLHLSQRYIPSSDFMIHLYQESNMRAWDSYSLLLKQPWQLKQNKAIVSFNPLNAHAVISNTSLSINSIPIIVTADIAGQYYVDEPVLTASFGNDLPYSKPEGILKSYLELNCLLKKDYLSYKQSFTVSKGWLAALSYSQQYYLPLISIESAFDYKYKKLVLSTVLNQYYRTIADNGQFLRESLDLCGKIEYSINSDLVIYSKLSNLLNKSKITFRTLPQEPASVSIGFRYIF